MVSERVRMLAGVGVGVGMVLAMAGLAMGQDALGDGRALDYNTRIGGTGANERVRDYRAEFRFRNALVTGNVPGGANFRGEVGYGMEFDFRQRVGSDDLFAFRRDSFTSGLAGTGIRGTEALQYQFALTVGNEPPRNLRGSLLTSRTGERLTGGLPSRPIESTSGVVDIRQATPRELGEYEPGTLLSLRSTSAFTAGRSLGATMLRMAETPEGVSQGLVASPLRGLAREVLLGDAESGVDGVDDPRVGEAARRAEDGQGEAAGERPSSRLASSRLGVATELRERMSEDFASRVSDQPRPRDGGQQDEAGGAQPAEGAEASTPAGAGDQGPGGEPGAGLGEGDAFLNRLSELQRVLREGLVLEGEAGAGEGARGVEDRVRGWDELVTTLKAGAGTVEVPKPTLDRASAYELHLERAQEMMGQGRFFEAEQRFTMALAAQPGDPIASIGRIHAQLGAGLDLSAAVNLRSFLISHPEFLAARYEDDMLPSEDRLQAAANRLRAQLVGEGGDERFRESALLLAYVSFLRGDRVSLRLGLERMGEGRAGQRDALVPLLRAVWLDDGAAREGEPGADGEDGDGARGESEPEADER